MTTSRKNIIIMVVSLLMLLAIIVSVASFFLDANSSTDGLYFSGIFMVLIIAGVLVSALVIYFLGGRKKTMTHTQVSSKEINSCFITLKSISIDAKFECPVDCKYYKHDVCYWAQNSHIEVNEHKLEGIIVYFNLSYNNQLPPFFFYPGSVILRDSGGVEYRGVSLCDRISKISSWGRHCLISTQEKLYTFFPKLKEGTSIDAIRFLGLGKQKGFVEFNSYEINKLLLPFSDFISQDIMDLQLGPVYSLRKRISHCADGIAKEGLMMVLELYEKHLLSRYEVDNILKGFNIKQNDVK